MYNNINFELYKRQQKIFFKPVCTHEHIYS